MSTNLKSFEMVGKKESISNVISMIDPAETPFVSSIGTEKISNTLHQWQEDKLMEIRDNAHLEGAVAVNDNIEQPEMRANGTQILRAVWELSGTAAEVKTYGRDKELAYRKLKAAKSIKRDLEYAAVKSGQTYTVGTGAVAGRFAGVQAQIDPTNVIAAAGADMSQAFLDDALTRIYEAGGEATTLLVSMPNASKVSAFADSERVINDGNKTYTTAVEVYIGTAGTVKIKRTRIIRDGDAIVYNPKDFKLLEFRGWKESELAKTADSERGMIVGEYSLKHVNQKASALISGLGA